MSAVAPATFDSTSVRWSPVTAPRVDLFPLQISLLGRIPISDWKIAQPLAVTIERGDYGFIVSDDVFAIYGQGDDIADALSDYMIALTEYHGLLSTRNDQPSVALFQRLHIYLQHA